MFKNRYVRTIVLSRVLSNLGIWIRNFAILLYVTDLTHNDPLYVSLISVAEYAPIFLFAIIGGTFADRWQPRRTMIHCDLLSAVSIFLVLIALLLGSWQALLLSTFLSAVLSQFSQPSAMKLYKRHVPAEQIQGVMAMFQSFMAFFMVIGPVVGTYIYQQFGITVSLSVTGVLFIGSSLILVLLPRDQPKAAQAGPQNFRQELKDGLRYVWSNRVLKTLGGTFSVAGLAAGLIQPMVIFVTVEQLGQDKSFLQWLMMANGAAMLVGGGVIMSIAKKIQPHALLTMGLFVSAVGNAAIGCSNSSLLTLFLQVLTGLFYPCIHIGISTMIMRNTETAFVGRVGGALTPIFMGMMVVGMSLAGFVKGWFSLTAVFAASGCLFLAGALVLLPLFQKNRKAAVMNGNKA